MYKKFVKLLVVLLSVALTFGDQNACSFSVSQNLRTSWTQDDLPYRLYDCTIENVGSEAITGVQLTPSAALDQLWGLKPNGDGTVYSFPEYVQILSQSKQAFFGYIIQSDSEANFETQATCVVAPNSGDDLSSVQENREHHRHNDHSGHNNDNSDSDDDDHHGNGNGNGNGHHHDDSSSSSSDDSTPRHTQAPTHAPTHAPTQTPTQAPTHRPTQAPTQAPTHRPTQAPTQAPTHAPTQAPTQRPTQAPTQAPTHAPTQAPTQRPTQTPTQRPTQAPTQAPTQRPTQAPTQAPTSRPTSAPTSAPSSGSRMCASGSVWQPSPQTTWEWQLTGAIDTSIQAQMYDIDLFDNTAATIQTLHNQGRVVICYFSTQYEDWRSDSSSFTSAVIGAALDGWPGENYVDIRSTVVRNIMTSRMDMAVSKGCDGIEPDNVDGYTTNTGFPITASDQLNFNQFLATQAHARGLSVALKNDLDQAAALAPYFDFAINEQCNEYDECDLLDPFINAGKAVFNCEYSGSASSFCPKMVSDKISSILKTEDLDASIKAQCCTYQSGGCAAQAAHTCSASKRSLAPPCAEAAAEVEYNNAEYNAASSLQGSLLLLGSAVGCVILALL